MRQCMTRTLSLDSGATAFQSDNISLNLQCSIGELLTLNGVPGTPSVPGITCRYPSYVAVHLVQCSPWF